MEENFNPVSSHHFAYGNVTMVNEFEERSSYLTHTLKPLVRNEPLRIFGFGAILVYMQSSLQLVQLRAQ